MFEICKLETLCLATGELETWHLAICKLETLYLATGELETWHLATGEPVDEVKGPLGLVIGDHVARVPHKDLSDTKHDPGHMTHGPWYKT